MKEPHPDPKATGIPIQITSISEPRMQQLPPLATTTATATTATIATGLPDSLVEMNVKDFQTFISFMLTISVFGASTFAVIAGQMQDPASLSIWQGSEPTFTMAQVRSFLAVAWGCFVLALALAGYSSSALAIWRQRASLGQQQVGGDAVSWWASWNKFGVLVSALLHMLVVVAFLMLSVALVAYVGAIGWVMVGISSAALVTVGVLSFYQVVHQRKWISG